MKARPRDFLSEEHINHNSEVFDYIAELHSYLWRFVRVALPSAGGYLDQCVDRALSILSPEVARLRSERDALQKFVETYDTWAVSDTYGGDTFDALLAARDALAAVPAPDAEGARDKMLDRAPDEFDELWAGV